MKTHKRLISISLAIVLLMTTAVVASAMPPLPSSFYGTVKVDGANVPHGTVVSAWINGVKYAEATVSIYAGDAVYGLNLPGDDASTSGLVEGGMAGSAIAFRIGDQPADQTATWQSGTNVRLNLTATTAHDVTPPVTTASVAGTLKSPPDIYSAAAVTLTPNEPSSARYRIRPFGGVFGAWQNYTAPFAVTGEGANVVEFFSTDVAGNVEATKAITVKISTFPATGVLDNFDRRDGRLGSSWYGDDAWDDYRIVNNRVDVVSGGPLYWRGPSYATTQEAFVTLTTVDPKGREQDLLLKVQGSTPDWREGVIEVLYDARAKAVRVETYRRGQPARTIYANNPVTFQNGDRLGGRVLANGEVWIYRNDELIAKVTLNTADQTFFNSRGGRIGLWFINASKAYFDDFGGGSVP